MERLCRKCKEQPALLDGVLCADCRGDKSISGEIPEIPELISPPIHNRPASRYNKKRIGYSQIYHNLTTEQIQKLQDIQQNKCAVCGQSRFLVLNCDKSGLAKGYLCRGCNTFISNYENSKFVQQVKDYLKNPPADNLDKNPE